VQQARWFFYRGRPGRFRAGGVASAG